MHPIQSLVLSVFPVRWSMACAGLSLVIMSTSHALPIYGGPTYDSTTGAGYWTQKVNYRPLVVVGNGIAAGSARKVESNSVVGDRAIRWDASGTVTELESLGTTSDGRTGASVGAINAAGTVVGSAAKIESGSDTGYECAARWDASGTTATELGNLGMSSYGYTSSTAQAINDIGTAVGYAEKYDTAGNSKGERAVRWDASGTAATELENLDMGSSITVSSAVAVNAAGTAVGSSAKSEAGTYVGTRAVRWGASGTAATELGNLGTLPNGVTFSGAKAINDGGTAVGSAVKTESGNYLGTRAVRWDASGTAATELGNLGLGSDGRADSAAIAINVAGAAVGYAEKHDSDGSMKGKRAVRWDASGTTATELGNLGLDGNGMTDSDAYAINAAGTVVGYAEAYDDLGVSLGQRAVAWGLDGVAIDLNTLLDPGSGWVNLSEAAGISDTGWIGGLGTYDPDGVGGADAYERLFLMQIPEPSSMSLLAMGIVVFSGGRVRR